MTDPNLTTVEDPAAVSCKHLLVQRAKVGERVMYRCTGCGNLFSLKPFSIVPVYPAK